MASLAGGCEHVHTQSDHDPIDNHTCHCSVCKAAAGQQGRQPHREPLMRAPHPPAPSDPAPPMLILHGSG